MDQFEVLANQLAAMPVTHGHYRQPNKHLMEEDYEDTVEEKPICPFAGHGARRERPLVTTTLVDERHHKVTED